MPMLFFSCVDHEGNSHECVYGGPDIESCLDALTHLVNTGWQMKSVGMLNGDSTTTMLPVEAFDGMPMGHHLKSLQQEWEQLLCQERR